MREAEKIDFAITVEKQSESGMFRNERLLLIKSGFISYFSKIPKSYVAGNIQSIEMSGQLPKMTLSAWKIESVERRKKYIHMKFNKQYLIDMDKFKAFATGAEAKGKGTPANQGDEWVFKCKSINEAENFVTQINLYKKDPIEPSLINALIGYKVTSKSLKSTTKRYSEIPKNLAMGRMMNAMSLDMKEVEKINESKIIENIIEEENQESEENAESWKESNDDHEDHKEQESHIKEEDADQQKQKEEQKQNQKDESVGYKQEKQHEVNTKQGKQEHQQKQAKMQNLQSGGKNQVRKQEVDFRKRQEQKQVKQVQNVIKKEEEVKIQEKYQKQQKEMEKKIQQKVKNISTSVQKFVKFENSPQTPQQQIIMKDPVNKKPNILKLAPSQLIIKNSPTPSQKIRGFAVEAEELNGYSKDKSPRYQYSSIETKNKQELRQAFFKETKLGEDLLNKLSFNKTKFNKQDLRNKIKPKNRFEKRSQTLDDFINDQQQEKKNQKNQIVNQNSSSWSQLKNLKRNQSMGGMIYRQEDPPNQIKEDTQLKPNQNLQKPVIQSVQKVEKSISQKIENVGKVENLQKVEKTEKTEKTQKTQKTQKKDKTDKIQEIKVDVDDKKQQNQKPISILEAREKWKRLQVPKTQKIAPPVPESKSVLIPESNSVPIHESKSVHIPESKILQKNPTQKQCEPKIEEVAKIQQKQQSKKEDKKVQVQPIQKQNQKQKQKEKEKQMEMEKQKQKEEKLEPKQEKKISEQKSSSREPKNQNPKKEENKEKGKESSSHGPKDHKIKVQQNLFILNQEKEQKKPVTPPNIVSNSEKPSIQSQIPIVVERIETTSQETKTIQLPKQEKQFYAQPLDVVKLMNNLELISITEEVSEKESEQVQSCQNVNGIQLSRKQGELYTDDDCISFKNLDLTREPQSNPHCLTPRFWEEEADVEQTPKQQSIPTSMTKNDVKRKTSQISFVYWQVKKKSNGQHPQSQQIKQQCNQQILSSLHTKNPNNKVKETIRKILVKLRSTYPLKLPPQICNELLHIRKTNKIRRAARDLIIQEVEKQTQGGWKDSYRIVFGGGSLWNGWRLHLFEDFQLFANVLALFNALNAEIEAKGYRMADMHRVSYKGMFGLFVETPTEIRTQIPRSVQEGIIKITGKQFYQENHKQIVIFEGTSNTKMGVWINPDYLANISNSSSQKDHNWCGRTSWFDSMNTAITQSKIHDIAEVARCAWSSYLEAATNDNSVVASQNLEIVRMLFSNYYLSLKLSTDTSIEPYSPCKVEQLTNSSLSYINRLYEHWNKDGLSDEQRIEIVMLKALKMRLQSQAFETELEMSEIQNLLVTLAEFYHSIQHFQECFQLACYSLSLVVGEKVMLKLGSEVKLRHTKLLLVEEGEEKDRLLVIYNCFLRMLAFYFHCQRIKCLSDQNWTTGKQILQELEDMLQKNEIGSKIKVELKIQIIYYRALIYEAYLLNSNTVEPKKQAAYALLATTNSVDQKMELAVRILLDHIDYLIQAACFSEGRILIDQLIGTINSMGGCENTKKQLLMLLNSRNHIVLINNNKNLTAITIDVFMLDLEYYLSQYDKMGACSEHSKQKTTNLNMIRKVVKVVCQKIAYNDVSMWRQLVGTLQGKIDSHIIKSLLSDGLELLEPQIRKRIHNKTFI